MKIFDHFQHINLTSDQQYALEMLQEFLESDESVFILQGYAGSGKTTLLKGLVEYLNEIGRKSQLMAPTGRAAKVIKQKTGFEATTIHKGIYSFDTLVEYEASETENNSESYKYFYKTKYNPNIHETVLIIDEASMISNISNEEEYFRFGSGCLLNDLIDYSQIKAHHSGSKIIFVGDPAQLPPIGMNFSPALDKNYLAEKYELKIVDAELKEVKRHNADNGILSSATKIRKCLTSGFFNDFDVRENGNDVFNPKFEEFIPSYNAQQGTKVVVSFKNKTASDLNQIIRKHKYGSDIPILAGDIILVGGNHYRLDIMNGEFGVVSAVASDTIKREVRFNLRDGRKASVLLKWRQVELVFPSEGGNSKMAKGYMLENFLYGDSSLNREEKQALYIDFKNRNPNIKPKTPEFKDAIINDPFFNCILLKYGYAVTCHKAQGGEWDSVYVFWDKGVKENFNFLDSEHNRSGKTNSEFYRWAYTAITRASGKLFCINPPYFNSFSQMAMVEATVQNSLKELTGHEANPIEVVISTEDKKQLEKFNLTNAPLSFQNHFLLVNFAIGKHCIDILKWEKVGYEVRYLLKRENDTCKLKFWINVDNKFNSNFQKIPTNTNSETFFEEISALINATPAIIFSRNTVDTIIPRIVFDVAIEEEKPFLGVLFDSLQRLHEKSSITIDFVEHLNYRERYTFTKDGETAVIDFEYNGDGFFGRVLPIENKCSNIELLKTVLDSVSKLKEMDYVI
ncbi:MAG: hypothetical protein A2W93_10035 [Bacteroidetes bacterium GWF2_43_63]|nr:MAG: hypothetical protein A2W94_02435 [Bacteroidetes bacterium GWE2_42_42]OFY52862.1 MAG: hypothetical protein A2W93_10035 [Bacteroidetes bacterium GWF2_43_63]HBG70067.1 hypothetical protein [Bacteroidales bacterium]HCB62326.1 hypothetical protein [Bacteroidales bacterium]